MAVGVGLTALAVLALRAMGCSNVRFRVPNRFEFGYGLTAVMREGPAETLTETRNAQPAILAHSVAATFALGDLATATANHRGATVGLLRLPRVFADELGQRYVQRMAEPG